MTVIEPLAGTDETVWSSWPAPAGWPELDLAALADTSVVVLAAHPDDEVLGVGGLLARLAGLGADLRLVWATDGEASHPCSTRTRRLPAGRRPSVRVGPGGGAARPGGGAPSSPRAARRPAGR